MNELLQERVREIVVETLHVNPVEVDEDTSAQTLAAWTSLAHLRLLTNLQDAFSVRFTTNEMVSLMSVRAIEAALESRGVQV